jgi:hypothetical protein
MSETSKDTRLLFVNGINTDFGGSVAESNKVWFESLRSNAIKFEVLNTVPNFGFNKKYALYFMFLSIYFFSGTLFRIIKSPIAEFAYKFSLLLLIRFIWNIVKTKTKKVIFSHHSIFYLALFCSRASRIFLIHDLMYVRARSRGASRRWQRFILRLELRIYQLSPTVFVQSYHECRLLQKFLTQNIYLISCCNLQVQESDSDKENGIAVISDWRRPENSHGVLQFLAPDNTKNYSGEALLFNFFGFDSQLIVNKLESRLRSSKIILMNGGYFNNLADIKEGYFFVPIYQGAGIKRKTLEALCSGRMVVGTRAAFIGLPPWLISAVTCRVNNTDDLQKLPNLPDTSEFNKALIALSQQFQSIGELKCICN